MLSQTGQARRTALSVGAVLLALALWSTYRHHPIRAESLGSAGVVLLLLGAFCPRYSVAFHNAWMKFAAALGYINSRVLLAFLFYGIFTPLGLMLRLSAWDPLNRRRKKTSSFWVPRVTTRQSREQFERLF